jgi:hypothetical protein
LQNLARTFATILLAAIVCAIGCRKDETVRDVRELRFAGQADSARALALSALSTNANRMDLWLELTKTDLELCRVADQPQGFRSLKNLLEAGLTCAAMYAHDKQQPPREWRDIGRLASAETGRQMNRLLGVFNAQIQALEYLKRTATPNPDAPYLSGQTVHAQQIIEDYKNAAPDLLHISMTLRRLLETLPEPNPGTASLLIGEVEEATASWAPALDLDPALIAPVQFRSRTVFDKALARAKEDLNELGYFLTGTIVENGALP